MNNSHRKFYQLNIITDMNEVKMGELLCKVVKRHPEFPFVAYSHGKKLLREKSPIIKSQTFMTYEGRYVLTDIIGRETLL